MFDQLPTEIIIEILSHLPVRSINTLSTVSHVLEQFIQVNQSAIYRNAALHHGYIRFKDSLLSGLTDVEGCTPRSLGGVDSWKTFCKQKITVELAWKGKRPSTIKAFSPSPHNPDDVHRIKVDEHVGIVITSFREGGIAVSDLEDGSLLWALSEEHVPGYAHVEYDKGYLIFNMFGTRKEVWRLVEQQGENTSPTYSRPDSRQERAYGRARMTYVSTYPRGHFSPWCVLNVPTITSAFRFVYPTLLTATRRRMYLYHVPSGRLEKDIRVSPEDPELNVQTLLSYVELGERYIFLCGYPSLRILSRETGRVLWDIPSDRVTYSNDAYVLSKMAHRSANSALCVHDTYVRPPVGIPPGMQRIYEQFGAVHISPCGRHLVLLGASSRILVFPYFERLLQGSLTYEDIAIELELGSRTRMSQYLAFDGTRIGVVTGTGVYIIHVPALVNEVGPPSVCRVFALDRPQALIEVSCLQMTDTALWLTWKYPLSPEDHSERVDFSNYLEERLEYSVFTPEHPIGAINLRPAPDHDPLVEVTLAAVCMIDFADPTPSL